MDIKYKKEYESKKWVEDFIKKLEKEVGGKLTLDLNSNDPNIKAMSKMLESVPRERIPN